MNHTGIVHYYYFPPTNWKHIQKTEKKEDNILELARNVVHSRKSQFQNFTKNTFSQTKNMTVNPQHGPLPANSLWKNTLAENDAKSISSHQGD